MRVRQGGDEASATDRARAPERDSKPVWHALSVEDVLASSGTSRELGLFPEEAARRLQRFGPNALPEAKTKPLALIFLRQFKSPLIYLLFIAAGIAFALSVPTDALVILGVVFLNAVIGTFQEGHAERALTALRRLSALKVRVLRGGIEKEMLARELVPGDLVLVAAGDAVGADARLVDAASLALAEAALTGESLPVSKVAEALAPDTLLAERRNMIYAGTHVTSGRGKAVVVATGSSTEVGKIAALTAETEEPRTPLEERIDRFGRFIVLGAALLFASVLGIGLLRGFPLAQILMVAISQVVSMVPEGLPVAMTIALAVGVQRMARRRTIVRRLSAIESLGSTTVILSDKTGTLTRNEMTVVELWLPDEREVVVTGTGYAPEGAFLEKGKPLEARSEPALLGLLETAALCNDARLVPPDRENRWQALGDPTEAALVAAAAKAGLVVADLRRRLARRAELPFDASSKMMATEHATPDGSLVALKGAPEAVLGVCSTIRVGSDEVALDAELRERVRRAAGRMAGSALRVLAFASGHGRTIPPGSRFEDQKGLSFLGLAGELDPPRPEVHEAVLACREAGIRPVVVTGDDEKTGLAVARLLGIVEDGDRALDGRELEALPEPELASALGRISVFARVEPAQKLRIVKAFQATGAVVAMTGDGVNDAPALARADVGVAMGISGTEVAKEAAKVVVTDDNFATIVAAVEEGRLVYRNLKKLILYLFSSSMAAVLVLLAALLLGYPLPLAAVQILWINVVTETAVTVNLVMDPPERSLMRCPPVRRGEPLLDRALLSRMALMTPVIALSVFSYFVYRLGTGESPAVAQTATFTALAVCLWFNVLNCRSESESALSLGILQNRWLVGGLVLGNALHVLVIFVPALNRVFHTVPLAWKDVFLIGAVGSVVLWVEEIRKLLARRRERARTVAVRSSQERLHGTEEA